METSIGTKQDFLDGKLKHNFDKGSVKTEQASNKPNPSAYDVAMNELKSTTQFLKEIRHRSVGVPSGNECYQFTTELGLMQKALTSMPYICSIEFGDINEIEGSENEDVRLIDDALATLQLVSDFVEQTYRVDADGSVDRALEIATIAGELHTFLPKYRDVMQDIVYDEPRYDGYGVVIYTKPRTARSYIISAVKDSIGEKCLNENLYIAIDECIRSFNAHYGLCADHQVVIHQATKVDTPTGVDELQFQQQYKRKYEDE